MPCVLPVISLKIFGFIKHAGDSRARIFGNGLAFTAGIFAWFVGLALLLIGLKAAGHEITWAFQFTNPYFVVAMSAVVLVFALNLLGSLRSRCRPQPAPGWSVGVRAKVMPVPSFREFSRPFSPRPALRRIWERRLGSPSRNRPGSFCSCSLRSQREWVRRICSSAPNPHGSVSFRAPAHGWCG
jgi:hypothetical protein